MPRYTVTSPNGRNGRRVWYVLDNYNNQFVAGPFADSFGAHDACARLNHEQE